MTEKKRDDLGKWRPAVEREKGRGLIPTDLAAIDHARKTAALANAHFDANALMDDSDPAATATPATLGGAGPENATAQATDGFSAVATLATAPATVAAEAWAGSLQAALEDTLPGYAERDALGQLRAFTETRDALKDFLADLIAYGPRPISERPTAGDAGASLEKLSKALAALAAAWDASDVRTRQIIYLALGVGHIDGPSIERRRMERAQQEGAEDPEPPDGFAPGWHRVTAFCETAREIEKAARAAKAELKRDPSTAIYDGLIDRLGKIYTTHTGRPVNYSIKQWAARPFFEAVTAIPVLGKYAPTNDMIAGAVRRLRSM